MSHRKTKKSFSTFRKYSQIVSLAKNGESITTNDALFSQILNRCKSYIIWLAEIFFAQIMTSTLFCQDVDPYSYNVRK